MKEDFEQTSSSKSRNTNMAALFCAKIHCSMYFLNTSVQQDKWALDNNASEAGGVLSIGLTQKENLKQKEKLHEWVFFLSLPYCYGLK